MKTALLPSNRFISNLLIFGVILVIVPYTALTILFDYPNVLRYEPGIILTRFHQGGGLLIAVWWLFAISGFLLLQAYVLIGQKLEPQEPGLRWATTLGVMSGIVQIVGLLRWPFVVPVLAAQYVQTTDLATRQATEVVFTAIHQYGGGVLGEHLGQLLTIAYTVLLSLALRRLTMVSGWVSYLGLVASAIYLLAQGDLFATVLPGFPTWELAGLVGSTLWLVWLLVLGIQFRRLDEVAVQKA
ncbi:DUF4386 domain-containing protein [Spirosoma aerolatum]|uniref:DUF4386 domain-containing protein n=1 Tax=Spirosoma aerolatum TaxID=1211326 RepID=UPI0009AEED58|nr:DUF4386 domain-containing protein [Spirosoma aerolatum]